MPTTRILKRFKGTSARNRVNHFTVTAYSLKEARALFSFPVTITSWAPAQEVLQ